MQLMVSVANVCESLTELFMYAAMLFVYVCFCAAFAVAICVQMENNYLRANIFQCVAQ